MTIKTEWSRDEAEALYDAAIYQMQRQPIRGHLWDAARQLRMYCGMDHNEDDAMYKVDKAIKSYQQTDLDMLNILKESQAQLVSELRDEIKRLKAIDQALRDFDHKKYLAARDKFAREGLEEAKRQRKFK